MDSEDLEKAGIIVFHDDGVCNYGRLVELYLELTHPDNDRLFQTAKNGKPDKVLHNFDNPTLFSNANCGKNKIGSTIRTLSEMLGICDVTNHGMRSTGIQTLTRSGYDNNKILELTGTTYNFKLFID